MWYQNDYLHIREQIHPYDLSGNVFGYNLNAKNSNLSIFAWLPAYALHVKPDAQTFDINGHEAFVWPKCDELH